MSASSSGVQVIQACDGVPQFTVNALGKGKESTSAGTATLENAAALGALAENLGGHPFPITSDNPQVEWTWYPASGRLVVANGSEAAQKALITHAGKTIAVELSPWQLRSIPLS